MKPLDVKNSCSPTVKVKGVPQSTQFRVLSANSTGLILNFGHNASIGASLDASITLYTNFATSQPPPSNLQLNCGRIPVGALPSHPAPPSLASVPWPLRYTSQHRLFQRMASSTLPWPCGFGQRQGEVQHLQALSDKRSPQVRKRNASDWRRNRLSPKVGIILGCPEIWTSPRAGSILSDLGLRSHRRMDISYPKAHHRLL